MASPSSYISSMLRCRNVSMVCFLSHGQSMRRVYNTERRRSNDFAGVCCGGGGVCDMTAFFSKDSEFDLGSAHFLAEAVNLKLAGKVGKLVKCGLQAYRRRKLAIADVDFQLAELESDLLCANLCGTSGQAVKQ